MAETDLFGAYVRTRLEGWGREFAYCRDGELLGHQSKNILQTLIDHRGEMPGRVVGFKPLEVDLLALQVEDQVRGLFLHAPDQAWALRAYFCGSGRAKYERHALYNQLAGRNDTRKVYFAHIEAGTWWVRQGLLEEARAA